MKNKVDLIVIGAGIGGYVAAIRAAQLGRSVLCIEKRATLGGTCLNVGCIPSKALLSSSHKYTETQNHLSDYGIKVGQISLDLAKMMEQKNKVVGQLTGGVDYLFKKNKIAHLVGTARFLSPQEVSIQTEAREEIWHAKKILIATGSVSASLPGIEIDEETVVSSTGALNLKAVPEHLIVVGGGYIGLEMGSVWSRLGAKVTVIEFMDRLVPQMDLELSTALQKSLVKQGLEFRLSTRVLGIRKHQKKSIIDVESNGGGKQELQADVVLIATGRKPFTDGLGLEKIGVALNKQGFIVVNEHYETSTSGIYAIGDVIPGPMLAHKAEEEGTAVAEIMVGQAGHVNYGAIPSVIYTSPEVASVGQTEEELKDQQIPYKVGKFPFLANSRAKAVGDTEGFVKILAHAYTDRVLGVHIIGPDAGTLIAEATLALEFSASSEDIARTCHAHPTLSEAVKEAAMAVEGRAIHI
ncbi:MAG: dihydrolipoyl dehydrogenase [Alphaproteobacteria bacterium]|nr:dihydrolipoyl dehydrogenase [Alphaproteobacteria bacterium]